MPTNNTMRSASVHKCGRHPWRHGLSTWQPSSAWPCLGLILIALGLLWYFHHVTHVIVQHSAQRLQSFSVYSKATWQCNGINDKIARENCLSQRKIVASESSVSLP